MLPEIVITDVETAHAKFDEPLAVEERGEGLTRQLWARVRRDPASLGALVVLTLVVVACLLAPLLAPYNPNAIDLKAHLAGIGTDGHVLGTDALGRDVLSRLLYGGRITLLAAFLATAGAILVGGAVGVIAGYFGRWQDFAISRVIDTMLAFPYILLAIAIATVLGPGLGNSMIAIGVVAVPLIARLVRARVMIVVRSEYVRAARGFGGSHLSILARHVVPNSVGVLIVFGTLQLAGMMIAYAGLSFLGLGVRPPQADWGGMLAEGQAVLSIAPHLATIPGLAIFIVIMAVNVIGEAFRDVLDPHKSQR